MASKSQKPIAVVGHKPDAAGPRIEITPTPAQYEQLCHDLKKLRRAGAISNTAAILDAVQRAATGGKITLDRKNGRGARKHSPAPQQEV